MKQKLYSWAVQLLPIAGFSALVDMLLFYLYSYWLYQDGVTTQEVYSFLMMPILIFLISTLTVNYMLLRQYRFNCFAEDKRPYPGWVLFTTLFACVFLFGLVIDAIYFLIDPNLSEEFSRALQEMLTSVGEAEENVRPIASLTLFAQNYVGIALGIFIGTLVSLILAAKVRKPVPSTLSGL